MCSGLPSHLTTPGPELRCRCELGAPAGTPARPREAEVTVAGLGGDPRGPSPLGESDSLMASGWWRWRGRGAAEAGHLRGETPPEAPVSGAEAPRAPQGAGDVEWAHGGPCGLLPPLRRWPGSVAMFDLGFSAKPPW